MLSNAYPILIHDNEIDLRVTDYTPETLNQLRSTYNRTHSFFRRGDKIFCLWNDGSDIDIGNSFPITPNTSPEIIDSLIHHVFFRTIIRELPNLAPLSFYPLRIISRKKGHDALRDFLPEELQDVVCYNLLIELQTRRVNKEGVQSPHLLINMKRRWRVNQSLEQLAAESYSLIGVPVVHSEPIPGLDGVLAPSETALGRVESIRDGNAIVDTYEGKQAFPLKELFIRKSRQEIENYLRFKMGDRQAKSILEQVFSLDSLHSNAEELHNEMQQMAGHICKWQFQSASGFAFKVTNHPILKGETSDLPAPKFLFDVTPGAGSERPLSGLLRFGPYDKSYFRPKELNILVICQSTNRGGFTKTLAALADGIPDSTYFQKGLRDLFRLRNIKWDIHETQGPTPQHFKAAIRNAVTHNDNKEYDLAIVEGNEAQKKLPAEQNAFIMAKALLLGMGIPVQGIKQENVRKTESYLGSILGPMALQIYAKLGGIPWTLPGSKDVDRELIVGIGSTEQRDTEFKGGGIRRIVGLTTFFANDGRFLMANTNRAVPYEDYFEELLTGLETSINTLSRSEEQPWEDGDTVRIIFHIFKPIKNIEADVVAELIKKFPNYDIRYAFVTVSTRHPFIMFDKQQRGSASQLGNFVPARGTNIKLSDTEWLVQIRGNKEIKAKRHGFSRPVLVKIHEKSTFKDLHHIVEQVMNFTHLSWKTFFPTYLPVTIFYADEIAKWLDLLDGLPGWNPEIINTSLKRKKWFL